MLTQDQIERMGRRAGRDVVLEGLKSPDARRSGRTWPKDRREHLRVASRNRSSRSSRRSAAMLEALFNEHPFIFMACFFAALMILNNPEIKW